MYNVTAFPIYNVTKWCLDDARLYVVYFDQGLGAVFVCVFDENTKAVNSKCQFKSACHVFHTFLQEFFCKNYEK